MKTIRYRSFEQLVEENKEQILNDPVALDELEQRWELKKIAENKRGT